MRYRIRNNRNQPVELHYSDSVKVLGPHMDVEVAAEEIATEQVQTLHDRGFVSIREVPEQLPGDSASHVSHGKKSQSPRRRSRVARMERNVPHNMKTDKKA